LYEMSLNNGIIRSGDRLKAHLKIHAMFLATE
jgi:hypothetical protein